MSFIDFLQKSQALLSTLYPKIKNTPKVYLAQGYDGLQTQCSIPNNQQDLVYKIGGENIILCNQLNHPNQRLQINPEILTLSNPDVIFVREIQLYHQLQSNPPKAFRNLKAIKDKRFYYAPSTPSNWLIIKARALN